MREGHLIGLPALRVCPPVLPLRASLDRFECCMGFAFSLHLEYNIYHCIIISRSLCVESNLDTSRAHSKLSESAAIKWRLVSWVTPQFSWAINQEGGGAEGDATERKSEKGE